MFSKHLEIRITIKSADQTNKTYRLNYSQNFSDVYFISMVITQPKLIAKDRGIKVSESRKVHLIYLVFYIANK